MSALPEIVAGPATGSAVAIASDNDRSEILLKCRGSRVYLAFNEDASVGAGIWLDDGEGLVIAYPLCQSAIYMVSAGTGYVGAETVF